jgi:hypothetical protein
MAPFYPGGAYRRGPMLDEGATVRNLVELLLAISRLSLPATAQLAWLSYNTAVPNPDELAVEFGNRVDLVPEFVEQRWLTRGEAEAIGRLDQLLLDMSGPDLAHLWTEEALHHSPEWDLLRREAQRFLGDPTI